MARLTTKEISDLIPEILGKSSEAISVNWHKVPPGKDSPEIYVSQCKSSWAGEGKWNYTFFHTLGFETIQDIGVKSGVLILVNYIDFFYAALDTADLMWLVRYSARTKSNDGLVCDIVIDLDPSGEFYLRPYDRNKSVRRQVAVKSWRKA